MKLLYWPNPKLKQKCAKVTEFDLELHKQIEDMFTVMVANNGIGLSANQVGIMSRIFVMVDQKGKLHEFVNPEILDTEGNILFQEGCLSAPKVYLQITRSKSVTVKAKDRKGEEFTVVMEGIDAVCAQHEMDHLNGVFYFEKVSRNIRRAAEKVLKKNIKIDTQP